MLLFHIVLVFPVLRTRSIFVVLTGVLLVSVNERGERAEKIVNDIITEQSTDVDAVSGATNSSTVIKKAVEEALEN